MENILDLKQRIALVTGAGQGVGRQSAMHFAANGAKAVIVNDYVPDRAHAVAEEVRALGCIGYAMPGDVTDFRLMNDLVGKAASELGGLHILVNNAGNAGPTASVESFAPFWETSPADWSHWLGTNLYGVLNLCRVALPIMLKMEAGSIINVISDAGRVGEPHLAVYSAAKAGASGFSRALAKAVGSKNIRVNSVALASINTPGVQHLLGDPETVKRMLRQYIIRRLGEPNDAANMILFLASDASSWISGQTYPVNGGYSRLLKKYRPSRRHSRLRLQNQNTRLTRWALGRPPMFDYKYRMEHVCSVHVELDHEPQVMGLVAGAIRGNFFGLRGEVTGPRIQGRVLPRGVDYLTIRSDGVALLDVHLTVETNDKALIQIDYTGVADIGEDGQGKFLRNEIPPSVPARAVPRMFSGYPGYEWVNRCQFVMIGEASFKNWEISYDVYALR